MSEKFTPYLALYDCRSKQEYIYRTNRIKEITGGSKLLADVFSGFFNSGNTEEKIGFRINADWKNSDAPDDYLVYFENSGYDAEVIYEGGGNICVIYRSREKFIEANRILSRKILEDTFTVSIIASGTEVTGDFVEDRKKLYRENTLKKNLGNYHVPCNVLPFTQTDRLTFQPVVKKESKGQRKKIMYTSESLRKKQKFDSYRRENPNEDILEDHLDSMTDKGTDSLLAVIYIDGNNMGNKIKDITKGKTDYSSGINALRKFSRETNEYFVASPIKEITKRMSALYDAADEKNKAAYLFREVISGGDEITLICNAHAVPVILDTYFNTLKAPEGQNNSSCAGVAIFHSHSPFADVYEIAEQCCESGKVFAHLNEGAKNNDFIDFHFCHSGITNSLDVIREVQEGRYTCRPYEFSGSWKEFEKLGKQLSSVNRSDVKALGEAIVKGDSYYKEELRRIRSRADKNFSPDENDENIKKMLFDISIVFDLWFSHEEKEDAENE